MKLSQLKYVAILGVIFNIMLFFCVKNFSNGAIAIGVTMFCVVFFIIIYHQLRKSLRIKFIEHYTLPNIVTKKFLVEHNYLSAKQTDNVIIGLKQFFMIYSLSMSEGRIPKNGFMMPSRIVDELWHNFMLDSENYAKFCTQAFGKMFHHKPGMDSGGNKKINLLKTFPPELVNTYQYIRKLKDYSSLYVIGSVPVLFALDSILHIDKGFYYDLESMNNIEAMLQQNLQASTNSGSTGSCGGILATDSVGGSDSGGDSGSCGGGCGGGGD